MIRHRPVSTFVFVSILALLAGCGMQDRQGGDASFRFPELSGPYLGQPEPGPDPVLFAPGLVSTGLSERDLVISPDGNEIYYGLFVGGRATIMVSRIENGLWAEPEVAPFARDDDFFYFEPAMSPGGETIMFLSTLPREGEQPQPGWTHQNIWAVDRTDDGGWSRPYDIGGPVNSTDNEFYPSLARNGTIYFSRGPKGTITAKLYRAERDGERFAEPVMVPVATGEGQNIYNVFVDPDERFLIGCVTGLPEQTDPGTASYHIFFHEDDGSWSGPVDMGARINIPGTEASSASVSPDGRFLFFAAAVDDTLDTDDAAPPRLGSFLDRMNRPRNGGSDIYWMDAGIIEELRTGGAGALSR